MAWMGLPVGPRSDPGYPLSEIQLIDIDDLAAGEVRAIWDLAAKAPQRLDGTVAWSFEGNGIRTRTTFLQAFRDLGLAWTELPQLLKTGERVVDLAGYLDPFYSLYVIRESDHARLRAFAAASARPVINAMSAQAHPCEVLSDAWFIDQEVSPIARVRIGLWGPPTNVLRSWHALARVLGIELLHFCGSEFHHHGSHIGFRAAADSLVDVLVTDSWPTSFSDPAWTLSRAQLARLGNPRLLPTPPFYVGKELGFDPVLYEGFTGYAQKRALLQVQRAIVAHAMARG